MRHRLTLFLPVICLVLSVIVAMISYQQRHVQDVSLHQRVTQQKNIKMQQLAQRRYQQQVQQVLPLYLALQQQARIGKPSQFEWLETLGQLQQQFDFQFQFQGVRALSVKNKNYQAFFYPVTLSMKLNSEEILITLIKQLRQAHDGFVVSSCQLERSGSQLLLLAFCEVGWVHYQEL